MSKTRLLTFAFLCTAIYLISACCTKKKNANTNLERACPDEWYQNKMPSTDSKNSNLEYFIIAGERRELAEFDLAWIKENCNIKPQIIQ